jgi:hypothetical protein
LDSDTKKKQDKGQEKDGGFKFWVLNLSKFLLLLLSFFFVWQFEIRMEQRGRSALNGK